jgi:hypothetical protein
MAIWRRSAAVVLTTALSACAGAGAERSPKIEYLGAGVLMVPVDRDETGCVRYRMLSELQPNDFTVYWRIDAGHFTNNRINAACPPLPAPKKRPNRV